MDRYKIQAVAKNYDSRRFGSLAGKLFHRLECNVVRKAFADLPDGSVIGDIPVGTGRLAEVLLARRLSVMGIDISAPMLEIARERLRHFGSSFTAELEDLARASGEGARFDAVLSARFLVHFPFVEQVERLKQLARLSRGRVVFTQAIDTPYHRFRLRATSVLRSRGSASNPLTPTQLAELLDRAGLRELRRYYVLPLLSQYIVVVAVPKVAWREQAAQSG